MSFDRLNDTSRLLTTPLSRRRLTKMMAAGTALGVAGGLAGSRQLTFAQATPVASPAASALDVFPQVTIVAEDATSGTGYTFGAPSSLPTGFVRVTLVNSSTNSDHHAMFMRPNEGVTPDQFMATAKSTANLGALLAQAKSIGGPGSVSPGQNTTVILNLEEGPYVLICAIPDANGMPHYQMGMMTTIQATASGQPVTTPPTADASVDLADFKFDGLQATVPTGQHIWKVTDTGQQLHEMAIFALASGVSADQFKAMLSTTEAPATPGAATPMVMPSPVAMASPAAAATPVAGPPPAIDVAGVAPMNPGETNYFVADFDPGNYAAACFVPDPATGKPHFMLGMFMGFTVQ